MRRFSVGPSRGWLLAVVVLLAPAWNLAAAQTAGWTATLLLRPNPSPFLADWERDPRAATLQVIYTGTAPQDYVIEATVRNSSRGDLAAIRSPILTVQGGPSTQFFTSADALSWETVSSDRATIDLVQRSGVLPEGEYQVCATGRTLTGAVLFQVCDRFTVALPEPPQLTFPSNGSITVGAQPVFQWTPVLAAPEVGLRYRVTIVERRPQQTPQTAVEANPVWLDQILEGAPLLVYPIDALPLRVGQEYVWRVEVTDALGRAVTREGRSSELWTFVAGDAAGSALSLAIPDTLDLVPGLVRVRGIRSAQVTESEISYALSGTLMMDVLAPFRASFPVTATDFRFDRNALPTALVRSGSLSGRVPDEAAAAAGGWLGPFVQLVDVVYDPRRTLLAGLAFRLPATTVTIAGQQRTVPEQRAPFRDRVLLTTAGFAGATAIAAGSLAAGAAPVLSDDVSAVSLREAKLALPGPYLSTAWDVGLFGGQRACASATGLMDASGRVELALACEPRGGPVPLPLARADTTAAGAAAAAGDSRNRPLLALERMDGTLALVLGEGRLEPNLTIPMQIRLGPGDQCGGRFTAIVSGTGVSARNFAARCDSGDGGADFGWLRARINSLTMEHFAYTPARGFDFRMTVDLEPWLPAAPSLRLPVVPKVTITPAGFAVPATDIAVSEPRPVELAGFGVRLERVRLPAFTLTWDDWRIGSAAGFRFGLDLDVTMPKLPAGAAACVAAKPLGITSAELAEGRLRVQLADTRYTPACALDLSASLVLPSYSGDDGIAEGDEEDAPVGDRTLWEAFPRPAETDAERTERERRLAATLAADATRQAARDSAFIERLEARHPELTAAREYEERERTRIANALREARDRAVAGADTNSANLADIFTSARHDFYLNVVRPRLRVAAQNCNAVPFAQRSAISLDRQGQLLGMGDDSVLDADRAETDSLVEVATALCVEQAATACKASYDLAAVRRMFAYERERQLLGAGDETGTGMARIAECKGPPDKAGNDRTLAQASAEHWATQPARPTGSVSPPPLQAFEEYLRTADTLGTVSVRLELERVSGQLVLAFKDPFLRATDLVEVERVPEVEGAIVLPDIFTCSDPAARRQSLTGSLRLGPYGSVDGIVGPLVPSCTISLASVQLAVTSSALRFSTASGSQSLLLAAAVRASFTAAEQPVTGTGNLTFDLLRGRMISGSVWFQGPVALDLPREQPVLKLELAGLGLDNRGMHADGRGRLKLPGDQFIGATLEQVTINPATSGLTSGRILFDLPFALEVGVTDTALGWKAVPRGAALSLGTGVRADLPNGVIVTPAGIVAAGDGEARLIYQGRDLDSLSSTFSPDFVVGWGPPGVRQGRVDFRRAGADVGYIDASGFHPDVGFVANALLPARLPLPSEQIAYLELRDAQDALRVTVTQVQGGVRITTPAGTTVPLVLPALDLGRGLTPTMQVAVDLTLNAADLRPLAGAIHAAVPESQRAAFDLSDAGLPVAFDTLSYERKSGPFQFYLGGGLRLFGARQKGAGRVELSLDGSGRLTGAVTAAADAFDPVPLVETSQLLTFDVDGVTGNFDASLTTNSLRYTLDVNGGVDLELRPGTLYSAVATLHLTEQRAEVRDIQPASSNADNALDFEGVRLRLSNLRVPKLAYSYATKKFDFELMLDAAPDLAQFPGLILPVIKDIVLRESGFVIPAWTVPDLALATTTTYNGFIIKPLAVRSRGVTYDWFRGRTIGDWGLRFDLEVSWDPAKLGPTTPAWIRDLKLSVLDAGISNGYVVGTIVQREIQQAYRAGQQLAISVQTVYGCLTDPTKQQSCADARAAEQAREDSARAKVYERREPKVDVYFGGTLTFGLGPACVNGASDYTVGLNLKVKASGGIDGNVQNIVPPCVMDLGVALLTPGTSSLTVAAYTDSVTAADGTRKEVWSDSVNVFLRTQANVKLPGPGGPADSVSFNGLLSLELFNRPRIVDGFIGLDAPIRLDFPRGSTPLVTFVVDRGRLDRDGLRVSGTGSLRTADGAAANADFTNFTIGFGDAGITAGHARILSQVALTAAIGPTGLQWRAMSPQAPRPQGSAFRITLPDTAIVDSRGLALGGGATAQLQFQDSVFASLAATFRDGFAIGFAPAVRVRAGRADFVMNGSVVAYVDPNGFFPGDVFGVVPLPARLALPTEDVAYIELRDASGQPLVETANESGGIRLSTRAGQKLPLVVPALKGTNGTAPTVMVDFSVVVNQTTYQLTSGSVRATAPDSATSLLDLASIGVPARVRRIGFQSVNGAYAFTLDARLQLPGALDSLAVYLRDVTVTAAGLSGTVEAGTFTTTAQPSLVPIATARLREQPTDTLSIDVVGVRAVFAPGGTQVGVAGNVRSSLFALSGATAAQYVPLFFSAQLSPSGFTASIDPAQLSSAELPIAVATFAPQSLGGQPAIGITATAQEFTVRLSGTLRVPKLGPQFALTVQGLAIGSNGIAIPSISTSGGAQLQVAELFGSKLVLQDSVAGGTTVFPAVSFARSNGVLTMESTGAITLLGNTARFYGLRVGTDARVSLAYAKLIDKPLVIVPNVLNLDAVTVQQDTLRADASVTLPKPLDVNGGQKLFLSVAPDGRVSGGGTIVAVNERPGLATAVKKFQVGPVLTAHLRYLALTIDAGALLQNSNVAVVADFYLQNEPTNVIRVGQVEGGTVTPGLTVYFDRAPQWGSIEADSFTFDFDVLKVGLNNISASTETSGALALGFNGSFALDLPTVSGGLTYENFRLTSDGKFDLDSTRVTGGDLTVAGVVRFQLSSFRYSTTPTTIQVSGSDAKDQATQSETTQSIAVSSFLRFGGRIDVAGVFSGAVDTFFVYRTADEGKVNVIVRNAELKIEGVVSAQGDLIFRQLPQDGFEFTVGARGSVVQAADVALVGTIGKEADKIRVGLFVAARLNAPGSGLVLAPPPGPPVIVITGLGGGIFLNPKAEHITLVKKYAGVSGQAGNLIKAPADATFAVMLYGAAGITPARVVEGQVLVTVTNTEIQLDGIMSALSQGDRLQGEAHLALRWGTAGKSASAQGAFGLVVDYGPMIRTVTPSGTLGVAALEFSVFNQSDWSITGNANLKIVSLLDATAKLAVGPFGFFAQAAVQPPAAIPLVQFKKMDAGAWYKASTGQWGMRVEADVTASVVVASVGAFMEGALVGQGLTTPYLYGIAGVRAEWPGGSYEGSVWAKMSENGIATGLGHDPAMAQLIADASDVMNEMAQSSDSARAAVAQARVAAAAISYTPQELAAAYSRVAGWNLLGLGVLGVYESRELSGATAAAQAYHTLYSNALKQTGAPSDTAAIVALADAVASSTSQLDARRASVMSALGRLTSRLAPLSPVPIGTPANPVRAASFTPVQTDSALVGGYWVKSVVTGTGPVVDIDDEVARRAVQLVAQQDSAVSRSDSDLRATLDTLELLLTRTRAATTSTADSSFLQYARLSGQALSAAERQFALQADYLQRRRDWYRAQFDAIVANYQTAQTVLVERRMRAWSQGGRDAGYTLAKDRFNLLKFLLTAGVSNAPNAGASFEAAYAAQQAVVRAALPATGADGKPLSLDSLTKLSTPLMNTWLATSADSWGFQAWWALGREGTFAAGDSADRAANALAAEAPARLASIREKHAALSQGLSGVYTQQAELTGLLYDLYDRSLVWRRARSAVDTLAAVQRKLALASELRVPTVSNVTVTERRGRYMSQLDFAWNGAHPTGVYEYAFRDLLPTIVADTTMLSVGDMTGFSSAWFRIAPPPSTATTTSNLNVSPLVRGMAASGTVRDDRTLEVRARGGAGFAGYGRATFQTRTDPQAPASPPPVLVGQQQPDATPPSTPVVSFPAYEPPLDTIVWTKPANRLLASWTASDDESGVGGYDYAVLAPLPQVQVSTAITAPSGGARPLIGPTDPLAGFTLLRPWTDAGGRTNVAAEGLTLPSGTPILVAVRARNGSGTVTSAVGFSPKLRVDATPPAFATASATVAPAAPASAAAASVTTYPACTIGAGGLPESRRWDGSLARTDGTGNPAARDLTFPIATDAESGVLSYMWKADTVPATGYTGSGWRQARLGSIYAAGAPLDYTRTFYASVVAIDRAGLASAPFVAGPFTVADRTPPTGATFCATSIPALGSTDYQLAGLLFGAATDPETGVVRYEYRVRSAAGATVLDWPPEQSAGRSASGKADAEPTRELRTTALPLVDGTSYFLDVRAVNAQGGLGEVTSSGPVQIDRSAPPIPTVVATFGPRTFRGPPPVIRLAVTAPDDPQSRLVAVEYAIGTGETLTDAVPWTPLQSWTTGSFQSQISFDPPASSAATYWLQLRTRNSAGGASAIARASIARNAPVRMIACLPGSRCP